MKTKGFIFDIDGVIADTPHEAAWKESIQLLFFEKDNWKKIKPETNYSPEKFTTDLYREEVSGKPRIEGARSVLKYFNIPDPHEEYLKEYYEFKQEIFLQKIEQGVFKVYDDAIMFLLSAKYLGGKLAAASSSKNANLILEKINMFELASKHNLKFDFINEQTNLLKLFDGNVCGIDTGKGKPEPGIFLEAAKSLNLSPDNCLVVEDAVNGVQAANAGGFFCIGIARLNNESELKNANADIVTNDLRKIFGEVFD